MRILSRDELDEQRMKFVDFIRTLNKLGKGFEDGTFKGENLRDMNSILQTRFLTFILSKQVHMSQIFRTIEGQIEVDFLTNNKDLSDDEFDVVFNS